MRRREVREGLVRKCEDVFRETRNRVRIEDKISEAFWTAWELSRAAR